MRLKQKRGKIEIDKFMTLWYVISEQKSMQISSAVQLS